MLADSDPPLLPTQIGQRVAFAESVGRGKLVDEAEGAEIAAREVEAFAAAVRELAP